MILLPANWLFSGRNSGERPSLLAPFPWRDNGWQDEPAARIGHVSEVTRRREGECVEAGPGSCQVRTGRRAELALLGISFAVVAFISLMGVFVNKVAPLD